MAKITIRQDKSAGTISRYIYGHFSEHLGHCIYGGLFVGKDSPIPNENGIRTDAVLAGRMLRGRVSLAGRHRTAGEKKEHGQHQLGRSHGGQFLWDP